MRLHWFKILGIIAAIWAVAGGVIFWANSHKPSPERLARYLSEHPVEGKGGEDRSRVIEKVADQLNSLNYDQRREMRMGKQLDSFFRSLNRDEQSRFLDLTLPTGFKQMMTAFNKMDPVKRKEMVDKALADMKKHEADGQAPPPDDVHVQKMVQQGMQSFYSDASADVKMDLAPLIEQMQKNLQPGR